ncbi:EcsC family protein [Serratia marcescens]|uniref:EcsC family protein n=1 Tax=Serratia marcescens TaxID=615 RepID=A0A5C7BSX0_SERMA|nr:EcsC family protein [Serratia marcescens]TXE23945.1 EcsC family protein [Serratia marcescens]TXE52409.1 EcsC family protein [Serratia marcescens]
MEQDKALTIGKVQKALDWAYDKAVNGVPGLDSAQELAASYIKKDGDPATCVNALIRWQNTKASTSGFLTGLGGIITLPIAIPANITSVMYIQIRMIAAIAHMGGYDLKTDNVRALIYACLCGNAAKDILKEAGIKIGTQLSKSVINKIPGEVLKTINKAVGFRLLTKYGTQGSINLVKWVPLAGGIIGGAFDGVSTNIIGNVARKTFITAQPQQDDTPTVNT